MITLLTDFGTADYFVPAVKGVIYSINPAVQVVDLTHEIPPQDIQAGAFTLGACYSYYPQGTIHLAVVDPGVGSERRAIVVETDSAFFVGPDNGIFTHIYSREENHRVFRISRQEFCRPVISPTFHGRDLFAPVAAWLSRGVPPRQIGEEIGDFISLPFAPPRIEPSTGIVHGRIIHLDRFGNCITNLTARDLPPGETQGKIIRVAGQEVRQFGEYYGQAERKDELFAYPGSAGYWEIALWCGSAAAHLGAAGGTPLTLEPEHYS